MRFDGRFVLDDVTLNDAWMALSDPAVQEATLPGCRAVAGFDGDDPIDPGSIQPIAAAPVLGGVDQDTVADRGFDEGDQYVARIEVDIGPAGYRFDAIIEIVERAFPTIRATARDLADTGAYSAEAGIKLTAASRGVRLRWWFEADVGARIDRPSTRMLTPVVDRIEARYAENLAREFDLLERSKNPA